MKNNKIQVLLALILMLTFTLRADAQKKAAFPQEEGLVLGYRHYDQSGAHDADYKITLRNVSGDNTNGHLEMVYNCIDEKGKAYFDGKNEFVMTVDIRDGQTYIIMDKMPKTLKVMNLISAGDASTICVPMTVGEVLPDTSILTTLGVFKATLTISEKKVLDRKEMKLGAKSFDCWLVHEKIFTKTPFGTDTATADTWYAEGAGCVKQTVYDAKGKLKGKLELISIEKQ